MNEVFHKDCLDVLKSLPDKSIDLVMTDPPYGIKEHGGKYRFGPQSVTKGFKSNKSYSKKEWDSQPMSQEYIDEVFRVSKNQVIFGMNYYQFPPTKGFVVWHKKGNDRSSFAACELIWTSFNQASKYFKYDWVGFGYINNPDKEKKQHPTQKPLALMKYLVESFSQEGQTILDPFAGAGTTLVAAKELGRNFIGIEKDEEYVRICLARLGKLKELNK